MTERDLTEMGKQDQTTMKTKKFGSFVTGTVSVVDCVEKVIENNFVYIKGGMFKL